MLLWHGRPYGCGSWLPEDTKNNMWHGRGKCCGLWPPAFPRSCNAAIVQSKQTHLLHKWFNKLQVNLLIFYLTTSNSLNYCFNVVFIFHIFLVLSWSWNAYLCLHQILIFYTYYIRSEFLRRFPFVSVPSAWYNFPVEIKQSESKNIFKSASKAYLIDKLQGFTCERLLCPCV